LKKAGVAAALPLWPRELLAGAQFRRRRPTDADWPSQAARQIWQLFLDWLARSPGSYKIEGGPIIGSVPARGWWDADAWKKFGADLLCRIHVRARRRPTCGREATWARRGWFICGFESLWLPAPLLGDDSQERLANALFAGSRHWQIELHFQQRARRRAP
jgi:hypothetical protein